jgi:transcription elongation factor GreA
MSKMDQKKIVLTKEGLERLKKELKHLINVRRKEVFERIAVARRSGNVVDEDTELEAALEEQSFVENRISELEGILKKVQVIETRELAKRTNAGLGSTVVVEVDGEKDEFTLVGSLEADPSRGRISTESLVGKALLGAKRGDVIKVASAVETVYKILEIK